MPVTLKNTQTTNNYKDTVLGGGSSYVAGSLLIANNPVTMLLQHGVQGQVSDFEFPYLTPGVYPLAGSQQDPIRSVRIKNAVSGLPAQVSGWLIEPDRAGIAPGTPYTQIVATNGAVSPVTGGMELAFVTFTNNLPGVIVTEPNASLLLSLGTVITDGVTDLFIEFFAPTVVASSRTANEEFGFNVFDNGTDIGRIGEFTEFGDVGTASQIFGMYLKGVILTPAAGSHTYDIRGWRSGASNIVVTAGSGGVGQRRPGYGRISTR